VDGTVNFAKKWFCRWKDWKTRKPDPEKVKSVPVRLQGRRGREIAIQLSSHLPRPQQVEVLERLIPSGDLAAILCSTSNLANAVTRYLEELHRSAGRDRLTWSWETFRATGYLNDVAPPRIDEATLPGGMYAESVVSSEHSCELVLQLDYGKVLVRVKASFDTAPESDSAQLILESVTPLLSSFDLLASPAEEETVRELARLFDRFCSRVTPSESFGGGVENRD
jgi:hypothetical protein